MSIMRSSFIVSILFSTEKMLWSRTRSMTSQFQSSSLNTLNISLKLSQTGGYHVMSHFLSLSRIWYFLKNSHFKLSYKKDSFFQSHFWKIKIFKGNLLALLRFLTQFKPKCWAVSITVKKICFWVLQQAQERLPVGNLLCIKHYKWTRVRLLFMYVL